MWFVYEICKLFVNQITNKSVCRRIFVGYDLLTICWKRQFVTLISKQFISGIYLTWIFDWLRGMRNFFQYLHYTIIEYPEDQSHSQVLTNCLWGLY